VTNFAVFRLIRIVSALLVITLLVTGCGSPTPSSALLPTGTAGVTLTPGTYKLENVQEKIVPVETIDIPIENCNGTSTVKFTETYTKTTKTTIDIKVSASIEASIPEIAKATLAAEMGISEGQEKTFSRSVELPVDAHSWVNYQLIWSEIHDTGEIALPNSLPIPYDVRKGLRGELSSGKLQSCPTPASTGTVASPNTPQPAATVGAAVTALPSAPAAPSPTSVQPVVFPTSTTAPSVSGSATSAPSAIASAFPCPAVVVNPDNDATLITEVYDQIPDTSPSGQTARVGSTVTVQRRGIKNMVTPFYLISDGSQRIGWVSESYLKLSSSCFQ